LARWAKDENIGIGRYLRKLPPEVRTEVNGGAETNKAHRGGGVPRALAKRLKKHGPTITGATIDGLLQDQQLRGRCKDLLLAKKHFDRAFREATTVLDDRLKTKTGIKNMNPANLASKVLNPQNPVIEVSKEQDEQDGFHIICKGIMLAFRNPAHHSLSDKFSREDALKFCGFIDTLLGTIEQADLHKENI
jgi:uncharacterized protein (TIGR02391 family)